MARPRKNGLDYVPFDVNFFHDIKVRKLLHRKGAVALTVYQVLLCEIYRQGYYLQWDDDMTFLISETAGINEAEVKDIIIQCMEVGLLDSTLYNKHKILTSDSIREVYYADPIVKMREYRKKHISNNETSITNNEIGVSNNETSITNNEIGVSNNETSITNNEMGVSTNEMRYSKRKITKKEVSLSPSPYTLKEKNNKKKKPTTTTTARVCEGENSDGDVTSKEKEEAMPVSQGVAELLKDNTWISSVQKLFNIPIANVETWLQVFSTECTCRDNELHANLSDIKRHFVDWLKKKDLSKESALSEQTKFSTTASRKLTGAEMKWNSFKQYMISNIDVADQPLVTQLEFGGFYPAFNKLVIKSPTNEVVDSLEQKYARQLKTAINNVYGKPHVEYNIAYSASPKPPP